MAIWDLNTLYDITSYISWLLIRNVWKRTIQNWSWDRDEVSTGTWGRLLCTAVPKREYTIQSIHVRVWALVVVPSQPGPHPTAYIHSCFKHNIKSQPSCWILQLRSAHGGHSFCLTVQMWQCARLLCFETLNWLVPNSPGNPKSLLNQDANSQESSISA